MKIAHIVLCALFLPPVASAGTCEVRGLQELSSSHDVQVTVLGAEGLKHVRIDVYEAGAPHDPWGDVEPRFSVAVDNAKGPMRLPKLTEGHYEIVAGAEKNFGAGLHLNVVVDAKDKISTFVVQLSTCIVPENLDELLARGEQMRVKDRVQTFGGIVYDVSGAIVNGAYIHVVRKETQGKERVAHLRSNATGHFSAQLQKGCYIAFFSMSGFRTAIVPFEIARTGSGEIRVTLNVMSTT